MLKKIWQKISLYRKSHPNASIRQTSKAVGVSKSMVQRQGERIKTSNQYSESAFWESESGQNFIKRIIVG